MHDAITIGVPVVVILFGILFNRSDVRRLEDKIDARLDRLESKVDSGFNKIDEQLIHFHNVTGRLEGRIDSIEKRIS